MSSVINPIQTIPLSSQNKLASNFMSLSNTMNVNYLHMTNSQSTKRCMLLLQKKSNWAIMPRCSNSSSPEVGGGSDKQPLETILRLHNAIKNKDLESLSELIGDECRGFCNFMPTVGPLEGKKQVLEFFSMLMRSMGENVVFVIKPSVDGTNITVEWELEWKKTGTPVGKGYSFYTVHAYKGKLEIRNVEMIMEPLLQLEPLRLRLIGLFIPTMDRIASKLVVDRKRRAVLLFILIFTLAIVLGFIIF